MHTMHDQYFVVEITPASIKRNEKIFAVFLKWSAVITEDLCEKHPTPRLNEMKWWAFDIVLPQRCFTSRFSAGIFNRESSQLPGEYSVTRHRIICRGLAFYNWHPAYCQVSIHIWVEWECRVNPRGLMRVHYIPSHCPKVRSPDSEIYILVQSSIECPTLSVQMPAMQVLTILTVA